MSRTGISKVLASSPHAQTLCPTVPRLPHAPHPTAWDQPCYLLSITMCMHVNSKGNEGSFLEKKFQSVPLDQGTSPSAKESLFGPGGPPFPLTDPPNAPSKLFFWLSFCHCFLFPNSNRNLQAL